ncbi:hypothetical protein ACFQU1_00070 [Chelatococcus sp. GCM10030263]|uniref:hypothetical protein n=1 Tax=Chelatococcus sp. GCM10030263 TaxID=3273387 RepID=UPI00360BA954
MGHRPFQRSVALSVLDAGLLTSLLTIVPTRTLLFAGGIIVMVGAAPAPRIPAALAVAEN